MIGAIATLIGVIAGANVWIWIVQPILDKRKLGKQNNND